MSSTGNKMNQIRMSFKVVVDILENCLVEMRIDNTRPKSKIRLLLCCSYELGPNKYSKYTFALLLTIYCEDRRQRVARGYSFGTTHLELIGTSPWLSDDIC